MEKYKLRVKALCLEKGMSMKDLADRLGIYYSSLWSSLKGKTSPKRLNEIADILGVTVPELFEKCEESIIDSESTQENSFGCKVKQLCWVKGMSINDLAEKIGMTQSGLSSILRGKNPSVQTIKKIAYGLEVEVSDIMGNEDMLNEVIDTGETQKESPIADTVKRLCREQGLTQNELAAFAGMSQAAISRFLANPYPSMEKVNKIAQALGVDASELTKGFTTKATKTFEDEADRTFRSVIKRLCWVKGVQMKDLADKMGMTAGGLSSTLKIKNPSLRTLSKFADALGVEVKEISDNLGTSVSEQKELNLPLKKPADRFDFITSIGNIVARKGIDMKTLAATMNVSADGLVRTLRNGNPQAQTLAKIADCLGVKTYELFPEYEQPQHSSPAEGICCPNCGCRLSVKFEGYEE